MFTVTIFLRDLGVYPTFQEAFVAFFDGIKKVIEDETARIVLETACFITFSCVVHGTQRELSMDFWQVAKFAHEIGLLKHGELVLPSPEIASDRVCAAFLSAHAKNVAILAGRDETFPEYCCRPNEEAW